MKKLILILSYFLIILIFGLLTWKYFYNKPIKFDFIRGFAHGIALNYRYSKEYKDFPVPLSVNDYSKEKFASSIPVLVYHGISDREDEEGVSLDLFKQQMFALKKDGYQTIKIDDFYKFVNGKARLPRKSFLLTFDDGRKDTFYNSDPILKVLDYNAVSYVITRHAINDKNNRYYMNTKEIKKELKTGRWELGSHGRNAHDPIIIDEDGTIGNFMGNKMWPLSLKRTETDKEFTDRIRKDLIDSKEDLQKNFGIEPLSYAFPRGDYGQNAVEAAISENIVSKVVKEIYPLSFYQYRPQIDEGYHTQNYKLLSQDRFYKRLKITKNIDPNKLVLLTKSGEKKDLPYIENFDNLLNWIVIGGNLDFGSKGSVNMVSALGTSSGAYLDGSYGWTNFSYNFKASLENGTSFDMLVRAIDGYNYLTITFNQDKEVKVKQIIDGVPSIIFANKIQFNPNLSNDIKVEVNNNKINYFINGEQIINNLEFNSKLSFGSIGFKIWDPIAGNAKIKITNLKVEGIK